MLFSETWISSINLLSYVFVSECLLIFMQSGVSKTSSFIISVDVLPSFSQVLDFYNIPGPFIRARTPNLHICLFFVTYLLVSFT